MEEQDLVGPVRVGAPAAGGHCVARLNGRVVFVRHALPGELVMVRLTDITRSSAWRGDAVTILEPSTDRVPPRCPIAGPGLCGGCDFQHAGRDAQRALKTAVVAEQMRRIGGITWVGEVEDCGREYAWRTRMRYVRDARGRIGMRAQRSSAVIALPEGGCRIAHSGADLEGGDVATVGPAGEEIVVAAAASGTSVVSDSCNVGPDPVTETAFGQQFRVDAAGFWQVHPAAPQVLGDAVLDGLAPHGGDEAWDLFCGVGLFASALVTSGCHVTGVEGNKNAVQHARRNVPDARFLVGDVSRNLRRLGDKVDIVVLDPPRVGAGSTLMRAILQRHPRAVAYVSCDPATLARDLKAALEAGATLASLRAFDLFPQTHHVECVAVLVPGGTHR